MNSPSNGASPGIFDLPPSAKLTAAPMPGLMRSLCRLAVDDQADGGASRIVRDQRAQHARRVGIAAGAGIVLRVGDDDGARGARLRDGHGALHALIRRQHLAREGHLLVGDHRREMVRGMVGLRLAAAIGDDGGAAIGEIGCREAGQERQRRYRLAFHRGKLGIEAAARLHERCFARRWGSGKAIGGTPSRIVRR